MSLIRISESDDWIVDYDRERGMYRVSYFEDGHFKDEYWFDCFEEKEVRPHGYWKEYPEKHGDCSVCGKNVYDIDADFWSAYTPPCCPNCGAIMNKTNLDILSGKGLSKL